MFTRQAASKNSPESCGTWKLARFSVTVVINSAKSNFDAERVQGKPCAVAPGETSRVKRRGRRASLADCKLYATCLLYISSATFRSRKEDCSSLSSLCIYCLRKYIVLLSRICTRFLTSQITQTSLQQILHCIRLASLW